MSPLYEFLAGWGGIAVSLILSAITAAALYARDRWGRL